MGRIFYADYDDAPYFKCEKSNIAVGNLNYCQNKGITYK